MRVLFFAIWVQALLLPVATAQEFLPVGRFSDGQTLGWAQHPFVGETRYSLVEDGGLRMLAADSDASASAFYREIAVDLDKTPVLNWSWRVRQRVEPDDETRKSGDDFSARVYVVRSGGLAFWNTRAINYVWSYRHARGESWDNPFAGSKARMLALRDSNDQTGEWRSEKRNVAEDFRKLFGFSPDSIDGVAIMTDTDNTGQSAGADYGDIYFTAE
jgi:hypothetical protein